DLLKSDFPGRAGDEGSFVFADIGADPPAVATFLQKAAQVKGVLSVENPPELARNGRVATASFTLENTNEALRKQAVKQVKALGVPLKGHGDVAFASPWFDEQQMPSSEGLGLLAAIVVLLVAFGSVVAMGLP